MSKEFESALGYIKKLRAERQKVYGDGWLEDPINYEIWMSYGKVKRLIYMLKHGNNNYEKMIDSAIDLANYSIFLVYKLMEEKNKNENRNIQTKS